MRSFLAVFEEKANAFPQHIALLSHGVEKITYAELATQAARIGGYLRQQGVQANTLVGLKFEKSADYIAAMLGVWWAGGAFIPLDPALPAERRTFIETDANLRHFLTPETLAQARAHTPIAPHATQASDLAYGIYTSGSTGTPKGVAVTHAGLVNVLQAQIELLELTETSVSLFYLSHNFDASISDIGTALLAGATLCLETPADLANLATFTEILHTRGITYMDIPPSLLKLLTPQAAPASLKTILIGGEACAPETVQTWAPRVKLVNVYGPTEATICTSMCVCTLAWQKPLLGTPIPHITYHVLNENLEPAAPGTAGELFIGGLGLAQGYINQPALTERKFPHLNGQRFYRTGDKVIRHPGGDYEFLGRTDRQVKIRGQLVELEEVENKIREIPQVYKVGVVKRPLVEGQTREQLVAFVQPKEGETLAPKQLKNILQAGLPAWMVPQRFEVLPILPATVTDKVDLQKLKTHPLSLGTSSNPAQTPTEKTLSYLWQNLLTLPTVNRTDNFFEVGGDSLAALELSLEAEAQGITLTTPMIAAHPVLMNMARAIDEYQPGTDTLTARQLKADVAFNEEWQTLLTEAAARPQLQPEQRGTHILITGATGSLGSRLLVEVLRHNPTAHIHLLIRAADADAARHRLTQTLAKAGFHLSPSQATRLHFLTGDVAQPRFGLPEAEWETLAATVDTIYHCAAMVNTVLSYADLFRPNVVGTRQVLRFACTGQRKELHYASTLSVFVSTNQNHGTLKETDTLTHTQEIYGGYAQTKWAAEYLLRQVPANACAISIYRFGLITGDSHSGVSTHTDFLNLFLQGAASLGCLPQTDAENLLIDITPIDFAAPAFYHLSQHAGPRTWHLANTRGASLAQLTQALRAEGHPLEILPAAEWQQRVQNLPQRTLAETCAYLALCRCLPTQFEHHRTLDLFQATDVDFDTHPTLTQLAAAQITCPCVSAELIAAYVHFALPPAPQSGTKKVFKICIFGPESTGKSTLARQLAEHFKTAYVPEYAEELIKSQNGEIHYENLPEIARRQAENESKALEKANNFLFCDTDALTTLIWSDTLFGRHEPSLEIQAHSQNYDLTLLLDVDTPWQPDLHRYLPNERQSFFQNCQQMLEKYNRNYTIISGPWESRLHQAIKRAEFLLLPTIPPQAK